ncbi:hypothetical protein N7478_009143 [Penicillium angulare]|uniref:uncharacterized protein n=1 Tax=Penicillium angulare TaxID=116970 RepID=UPI0025416848|nr:uncharacterized protein N7478_009143 [Penicillium angulare]KAJ5274018.1 hypothetical protein N7478_009143 [Penicillium angulare]
MKNRYFLLDETIPAKEISRMMCRVVVDKLLPLHHFAPSEPSSTEEPSHHTNDIIPDILPEPFISTSRQDFVTSVHRSAIVSTLTTYLGLDLSREDQQSVSLHSESVKRFTLSNPANQFDRLVANPLYARDVFNLLQKARLGKAYLVVGFLTVTGAVWQHKRNREHSEGGRISVPAKRSKGHHLTFGHDDDEVEPGSDKEDAIEEGKIIIVYDDDVEEPNTSRVYEAGEFALN